ncbi:hypothetical protein PO909_007096 [Leuciscus waleckii]
MRVHRSGAIRDDCVDCALVGYLICYYRPMLPCNYGLRQDIDTALSLAHTAQYIPTASRSPAVAIAAVGTVDYMDENEEYFQRQASHRQSRRRFRKINQKGERQTIIDTVDPYPAGKPPVARGYHTVSLGVLPMCPLSVCRVGLRCAGVLWAQSPLCSGQAEVRIHCTATIWMCDIQHHQAQAE